MRSFHQRDGKEIDTKNSSKLGETNRRKNMKRLGGGGLSLQTFANLKSKNSSYNPALIKKQKEFYKNAKYVSKFRKSMKRENFHDKVETGETSKVDDDDHDDDKHKVKSNKRIGLEDVYKKTKEEMDKARMERDAEIKAKKEAKEEAEARRKVAKGKMMRKTRHGQPVMKYRIEHLLESIKKSAGNDGSTTA